MSRKNDSLARTIANMHIRCDRLAARGEPLTCSMPVGYMTGSCDAESDLAELGVDDVDDVDDLLRAICRMYRERI